jgi:hypothetical protein
MVNVQVHPRCIFPTGVKYRMQVMFLEQIYISKNQHFLIPIGFSGRKACGTLWNHCKFPLFFHFFHLFKFRFYTEVVIYVEYEFCIFCSKSSIEYITDSPDHTQATERAPSGES